MSELFQPEVARESSREVYDHVQRAFHWSMAVIIIVAVLLGLWASFLIPGTPLRRALLEVHKSFGMTALLLIVPRIAYRLLVPGPAELAHGTAVTRAAARGGHLLLYLLMVVMPISGYLFSGAGGYSLPFFGLFSWPRIVPHDDIVAKFGQTIHDRAAWAVCSMLLIHFAAVVVHEVFTPHSALARMLPSWRRQLPRTEG